MRVFLIVLVLLGLFATGWYVAFQGTDRPHLRGAPQIERDIHRAAIKIVAAAGGEPVEVRTSGRNITLTGPVESAEKRDALLKDIANVSLVVAVLDDMTVLDRADPFTIEIQKAPDGAISLKGFVPNRRAEDRLLAEARDFGRGARVSASLELAAGAPEGNWTGMVSTGLKALAGLNHGTLSISGDQVDLSGELPEDASARATLDEVVASSPMGKWTRKVTAAAPVDGYRFEAVKPTSGPLVIQGHAPDAQTRQALTDAAGSLTGREVDAKLILASGMPDAEWPTQVKAGLNALARLESGQLVLDASGTSIEGTVDKDDDLAAVQPLIDKSWNADISVRNPTPLGNMTVLLTFDGKLKIGGLLPEGLSPEEILESLPDADVAGIEKDARGKAADWSGALAGLSIVMPRFAELEVVIAGKTLAAKGLLKRDYSADGVLAALRSAAGRSWNVSLQALERRPLAEITLSLLPDQILISGVLPAGISPDEALAMAGDRGQGMGLAGGGEGDLAAWTQSLKTITGLFPTFSELTGKVSDELVQLSGQLRPGYSTEAIEKRLRDGIPDGWDLEFSAAETAANDGDRRQSLVTGKQETYRSGYWLMDVDFPVSPERCATEITAARTGRSFAFRGRTTAVSPRDAPLLNALASVAIRCLNSSDLRLEVSAHTSSVGNDAENLALTKARAASVVSELIKRGVRGSGVTSVGRGEEDPVATNNSADGRARNQRIAFTWLSADE